MTTPKPKPDLTPYNALYFINEALTKTPGLSMFTKDALHSIAVIAQLAICDVTPSHDLALKSDLNSSNLFFMIKGAFEDSIGLSVLSDRAIANLTDIVVEALMEKVEIK